VHSQGLFDEVADLISDVEDDLVLLGDDVGAGAGLVVGHGLTVGVIVGTQIEMSVVCKIEAFGFEIGYRIRSLAFWPTCDEEDFDVVFAGLLSEAKGAGDGFSAPEGDA
jgi:hypothetical protein